MSDYDKTCKLVKMLGLLSDLRAALIDELKSVCTHNLAHAIDDDQIAGTHECEHCRRWFSPEMEKYERKPGGYDLFLRKGA